GLYDLGTDVLAAYGENSYAIVDMYKCPSDLSLANYLETLAGLPARSPFLADPTGTRRAYLWSFRNTVIASDMDDIGYVGGGSMSDMTGTIPETSGDNGPDDSAAVWVEAGAGGASSCSAGNIRFDTPSTPSLRSARLVSHDCLHARIAAG